jgi:hypothetical protein
LATNLAQTKANGKPRAKYSSRARPNEDLSCRLFEAIRFLRFAAFALGGLNLGFNRAFWNLNFTNFAWQNYQKAVLLNPMLKICCRLNEIYLNLEKTLTNTNHR